MEASRERGPQKLRQKLESWVELPKLIPSQNIAAAYREKFDLLPSRENLIMIACSVLRCDFQKKKRKTYTWFTVFTLLDLMPNPIAQEMPQIGSHRQWGVEP